MSDDLLMRYDQADPDERTRLVREGFEDPVVGRAFILMANDRVFRALFELDYNGTVPFEDFELLQRKGLARTGEPLRTYVATAYGMELTCVEVTDKGRGLRSRFPGIYDPNRFFEPFVTAYLCRNTGEGIVTRRPALEAALDVADMEFLQLVMDLEWSQPLLRTMVLERDRGRAMPLLDLDDAPPDIEERRRSRLDWWSTSRRGVAIHDLSSRYGKRPHSVRGSNIRHPDDEDEN